MKKVIYFLQYLFLRILHFIILIMSEKVIYLCAIPLSFFLAKILNYRKSVIDINLSIAFPQKTVKERDKIRKKFYKHISIFIFEYIRSPYYTKAFLEHRVSLTGSDILEKYKNTSAIFITGHLGEFSLGVKAIGTYLDTKLAVILKRQNNPYIDKFFFNQRILCNQVPFYSDGALRRTIKYLQGGGNVCFLNDQNAGKTGMNVPFFKRVAPTMTGLPILKEKLNLPVVAFFCYRVKNGYYNIIIKELLFKHSSDKRKNYYNILKIYNNELEKSINKYPEQYLWSHRRWAIKNYEPNL